MTRVLHLVPMDGIGGVEVAVHSMSKTGGVGIDFQAVFVASDRRSANNPLAYVSALSRVLAAQPDVLICSLWRAVPIGILAKLIQPQIKLVSFLHDTVTAHSLDRLFHLGIARFADQIWVDSHATAQARLSPERSADARIVSFVLDRLPRASVPANPRFSFVSWCRLNEQKGIDRSIRLIALLRSRGIPATFDIWGADDGEEPALRQLCDHLHISEFVSFRGPTARQNLPEIAARHSFYLQLSRHEGMAMSVVEAMQLGLVPVVTPVGEIASYCEAGRNAVLVDPDRLQEAADVLINLQREGYADYSARVARHWPEQPLYHNVVSALSLELVANVSTARR